MVFETGAGPASLCERGDGYSPRQPLGDARTARTDALAMARAFAHAFSTFQLLAFAPT